FVRLLCSAPRCSSVGFVAFSRRASPGRASLPEVNMPKQVYNIIYISEEEIELRKSYLDLVGNAKTVAETLNKEIKDNLF
ncbi:hypothetical protein HN51_041877, partial [Arachis hypogaea]